MLVIVCLYLLFEKYKCIFGGATVRRIYMVDFLRITLQIYCIFIKKQIWRQKVFLRLFICLGCAIFV